MTCKAWIQSVYTYENIDTGEIREVQVLIPDSSSYRRCLIRLEEFISRIVTADFRKSWPLNAFLHARGWKVYHAIKERIFYPRGDGSFVL